MLDGIVVCDNGDVILKVSRSDDSGLESEREEECDEKLSCEGADVAICCL